MEGSVKSLRGVLQIRYIPNGKITWNAPVIFTSLLIGTWILWAMVEYYRTPNEKLVTVYRNNETIVYKEKEVPHKLEKIIGIKSAP